MLLLTLLARLGQRIFKIFVVKEVDRGYFYAAVLKNPRNLRFRLFSLRPPAFA